MPVLGDADLLDRRVIVNAMGWRASMCVFAQTHLSAAFIHNCRSSGPAGAEPGDSLTHASTPRCIANAYHETGDAAMAEDSRDGTSDGPAMCTCPGRRSQLPEYLRSLQTRMHAQFGCCEAVDCGQFYRPYRLEHRGLFQFYGLSSPVLKFRREQSKTSLRLFAGTNGVNTGSNISYQIGDSFHNPIEYRFRIDRGPEARREFESESFVCRDVFRSELAESPRRDGSAAEQALRKTFVRRRACSETATKAGAPVTGTEDVRCRVPTSPTYSNGVSSFPSRSPRIKQQGASAQSPQQQELARKSAQRPPAHQGNVVTRASPRATPTSVSRVPSIPKPPPPKVQPSNAAKQSPKTESRAQPSTSSSAATENPVQDSTSSVVQPVEPLSASQTQSAQEYGVAEAVALTHMVEEFCQKQSYAMYKFVNETHTKIQQHQVDTIKKARARISIVKTLLPTPDPGGNHPSSH
eukprot:3301814-Rhodomonas_salina.1